MDINKLIVKTINKAEKVKVEQESNKNNDNINSMSFSPKEIDLMIDSGEELNTPEAILISPKTSLNNQMIRDVKSGSISTNPDVLSQ